ncbi:hypothetical protein PoB_006764900 [Plakobranchus ocellatus]|uniref:Uncharacterized protein n=1 Tax=Plakobranchus ocellatus TaxID=259542 RepID=A0AAV4DAH2_9GAST|nr:hypothetical protein PoB_006764900 [Plakobranchus ocellatus]
MDRLFILSHPPEMEASYESYRLLFNTKFHIGLGYLRKDTCSLCDEQNQKITFKETDASPRTNLQHSVTERETYQMKSKIFYKRRTRVKDWARRNAAAECGI